MFFLSKLTIFRWYMMILNRNMVIFDLNWSFSIGIWSKSFIFRHETANIYLGIVLSNQSWDCMLLDIDWNIELNLRDLLCNFEVFFENQSFLTLLAFIIIGLKLICFYSTCRTKIPQISFYKKYPVKMRSVSNFFRGIIQNFRIWKKNTSKVMWFKN